MDLIQSASSYHSLRCRACTSSNGRLFNIHEYQLADAFLQITGTSVEKDKLPQHLCAYCSMLLLKCTSFRDMCLDTQGRLTRGLLEEKNTESLVEIHCPSNRFFNLMLSDVNTIECIDTAPENDIKDEPNIDIVDIDCIIKKADLKIEYEKSNNVKGKSVKRKRKIGTTAMKKTEIEFKDDSDDDTIAETKIKMEMDMDEDSYYEEFINVDTKQELEIENGVNNDKTESASGVKKAKSVKRIHDRMRKKVEVKKKRNAVEFKINVKQSDTKPRRKRKKKEEVTRKFRNPANDYMPVFDFATFENAYGVKIVVLTKEEQLQEIVDRKNSRNFLDSNFRCEDCGKGFDAEAAYNNHRVRHSPGEGPLACEICFVRFKRQCVRQRHQDVHRLKFLCNECSYVSRERGQARKHHAMHEGKTYECQHCGKSFIYGQSKRSEIERRMGLGPAPAASGMCNACALCNSKSSTYLSHVRLAHPAMNASCEVCGETFIGQVGLKMHKARAHGEKMKSQYKCSSCSVTFNSSEALNRHTDTAGEVDHKDLKPCEQCGENCASETALQDHVEANHPKESYRCEECNMTFSSPASYDTHHRRKHLNQRYSDAGRSAGRKRYVQRPSPHGAFVCEQCGRVMKNATVLRYHQRTHQEVKPFACNECPKSFALKTSLEWHMRSHTGEKPYQCPECPLAFSLKGNLTRHHKTAHLGMRASVPCPICGRIFTTSSCVRVHVNTVHHGQPGPKRNRKRRSGKNTPEALLLHNK